MENNINKDQAQTTLPINKAEEVNVKKMEIELAAKKAEFESKLASIDMYKSAMAVQTTFMNPNVWTQIRAMGKIFYESKALPSSINNEPQLVMVLQAGFEMGMTPIESLHSLYIVNGSINIYGKAVTRRLRSHGWRIQYKDETDTSCTAIVKREDEEYQETYTYQMAEQSGYTKSRHGEFKVGWVLGVNRKLKLRYGALSMLIKSYIPDVLGAANDIKEVMEDVEEIKPIEVEKQEKTVEAEPVKLSSLADKLAESRKKAVQEVKAIHQDITPPTIIKEEKQEALIE